MDRKYVLYKILIVQNTYCTKYVFRHNEFVGNILEGAISEIKRRGKTSTAVLKASSHKHSS